MKDQLGLDYGSEKCFTILHHTTHSGYLPTISLFQSSANLTSSSNFTLHHRNHTISYTANTIKLHSIVQTHPGDTKIIFRRASNHSPTTLHPPSNHPPTTLQPHSIHLPTTLQPHSNHTPTTPNQLPTTLQPHSDHTQQH